jgi:multicomponent Na+:H+ antiporter subunit C
MSWTLAGLIGVTGAVGVYLLLHRSLTRIILGLGLLANAVNLIALSAGGPPAQAPIVGRPGPLGDPVPQALVLTAIVIGLGVTAFLLALALRSWTIDGNDDVEDDLEDRRLARAELEAQRDHGPDPTVDDTEFPGGPDLPAGTVLPRTAEADGGGR